MDLQCGTQSFLMQISDDIEECLYYGHDKLVKKFLSSEGVNLALVNDFIAEGNWYATFLRENKLTGFSFRTLKIWFLLFQKL